MSTLTYTLLILAALVIGGVLLFNLWAVRKSKGNAHATGKDRASVSSQPATSPATTLSPSDTSGTDSALPDTTSASHRQGAQRSTLGIERQMGSEPSLGVLTPYVSPVSPDLEHRIEPQNADVGSQVPMAPQDLEIPVLTEPEFEPHALDAGVADAAGSINAPHVINASNSLAEHSVLSADFDYLVELALPSPQTAERLLSLTQQHRRVGAKPIAFDGLASDGQWTTLLPGQRYVGLRAGILLANRHGPMNAMEYSDFGALISKLAEQLDCEAPLADLPSVVASAREVDRRCAELDAQLGINIKTVSAISPNTLQQVAAEVGLTERGNGRYARLDEAGATLFTLAFGDSADRLVMLLDVPRSPAHQRPWHQMLNLADSIAKQLGGELVDDAGKALPPQIWTQIEEQLLQRYWALESAGVVPGSARALRLFN